MWKGIDISEHNGQVDMEAVKQEVDFVIIRAGYGSGFEDKWARHHARECERLGIPYGFYWYSYALNCEEIQEEAEAFVRFAKQFSPTMPLYLDMEDADGYKEYHAQLTWEELTEMCVTFCEIVERYHYWVGVYANLYWFSQLGDLSAYTNWVAQWEVDTCQLNCDMWQYTSSGYVKGVNGRVDCSYLYRDLREVQAVYYTVQQGDTLSEIAERYGTTWQYLALLNQLDNPNVILVGQVLKI